MPPSPRARAQVAPGDLLLVTATHRDGTRYLLGSFHGDTDGLATLPTLRAVHGVAAKLKAAGSEAVVVFGLDANTYEKAKEKKGKVVAQGVEGFAKDFVAKGYTSCWGDKPDPSNHTTFNARTFLQAQLHRATSSPTYAVGKEVE